MVASLGDFKSDDIDSYIGGTIEISPRHFAHVAKRQMDARLNIQTPTKAKPKIRKKKSKHIMKRILLNIGLAKKGKEIMAEEINIGWTVIGILPITLFFILFALFGGYMNEGTSTTSVKTTSGKVLRLRSGYTKKILLYIGLAKVK